MTELEKNTLILQKQVEIGDQYRNLINSDGYKYAFKPWVDEQIRTLNEEIPHLYKSKTDKEFGVAVGRLESLQEIAKLADNAIKQAQEASKKLGALHG